MLTSDVKRRIDAARDVLVGVAPNPTTQIEQITFALIYKFMHDMDQSAVKAGGEASFFTGTLKKYSWDKVLDSRFGNHEKLALYAEALEKFTEAKQLPELFRSIFRSAYLPYKSPETLGLFLKEMNHFDYTHPEELGNAYEYLLSIMSSQGDAGQFRTPRHIIDFMVDVINPSKDDRILDPACGTGGFLISSYKHILEQHDGKDDPKKKEKPLTPDDRKKLMANLEGYDIDPTMVRIAQVNMYLHQFKNPQIFQYDTLTSEERWNDKYDVILANPPFMSPRGGIRPHNKFGVTSNRAEVLFVDYIVNHLKPKGRAGIIVPEGIIFQNGNAYKSLRKNLVENGLYAVVSLPSGVFQPYSGVKTSVLLFNNDLSKEKDEIAFVKIASDGFDLGSSKRAVTSNDLPEAIELLKSWSSGNASESSIFTLVKKDEIAVNGDYNLSVDRYLTSVDYSNSKWPFVKLSDVSVVDWGNTTLTKSSYVDSGPYLAVSATGGDGRINHFEHEVGTTVLSAIGANCGKVFYPTERFTAIKNTMTITPKIEVILPKYLYFILQVSSFPRRGGGQPFVSKGDAVGLEIPLPPMDVQEQIVAELDGYAAIISGAKLITENWNPRVVTDPSWVKTNIGTTCKLHTGGTPPSTNKSFYGGDIRWLVSGDIHKGEIWDCEGRITQSGMDNSNARFLPINSVLIALNGQGKTRGSVALLKVEATCNQSLVAIEVLKSDLMPEFLYLVLKGMYKQIRAINGENQRGGLNMPLIREIEIPLPPLEVQREIVTEFSLESAQVKSAFNLIETYDAKISKTILRLWNDPKGVK